MGLAFCHDHSGSGNIVVNVITATPEIDSQFKSIECPSAPNETARRSALLTFEGNYKALLTQVIGYQASMPGSAILGAVVYGARETFRRFQPDEKYLVVFSDMQQSGVGVRNCVKSNGVRHAGACLEQYYVNHPDQT